MSPRSDDSAIDGVINSLRRITQAIRLSSSVVQTKLGITGAQLFVLQQLAEHPVSSLRELQARTFTDQSSVSVVVSRLVTAGYVTRRRSKTDARRIELALTAAGRGLLRRAPELAQARLVDTLRALGKREIEVTGAVLERIAREIASDEETAMFFEPPREEVEAGMTEEPLEPIELGDFTATRRMLLMSVIAIVLGVLATYVAHWLLELIALFTNIFFYQRFSIEAAGPADNTLGIFVIIVPVVGALIIGLMARYGSDKIRGHGIPEALEAILTRGSKIEPRVAVLKPISSAISIGSGGPFGAEGPIIMTGGAFGSLIAQMFHLTAAERKTLLVAGAAAGMSATFDAPVAAILLAVELLLFEWKPRSFVPVALACATAAAARTLVIGAGPLFPMAAQADFAGVETLVYCVLAGIGAGMLSGLLTLGVYAFEDLFKRMPIHWMWWPAFGGLAIGIGGYFSPHALGVGYDVIGNLLHGNLATKAILALVIVKASIWAISLGSGTSGGVLAPLLIMGGALGGIEANFFPDQATGFWVLVGMGAILGGTMRSPLTGLVFAVELTHDVNMLLPLTIAVTVAHAFTVLTLRRSILTEKVARRGFHVSREYAIDELEILFVRDVMETKIASLPCGITASEALATIEPQRDDRRQWLYPVLDDDARLLGAATFNQLTKWAAAPDKVGRPLQELIDGRAPTVLTSETLRAAVHHMSELNATRLLAVNPADPNRLVGMIALHDMLKARARHIEDETRRERILPWDFIVPAWVKRVVPGYPGQE